MCKDLVPRSITVEDEGVHLALIPGMVHVSERTSSNTISPTTSHPSQSRKLSTISPSAPPLRFHHRRDAFRKDPLPPNLPSSVPSAPHPHIPSSRSKFGIEHPPCPMLSRLHLPASVITHHQFQPVSLPHLTFNVSCHSSPLTLPATSRRDVSLTCCTGFENKTILRVRRTLAV